MEIENGIGIGANFYHPSFPKRHKNLPMKTCSTQQIVIIFYSSIDSSKSWFCNITVCPHSNEQRITRWLEVGGCLLATVHVDEREVLIWSIVDGEVILSAVQRFFKVEELEMDRDLEVGRCTYDPRAINVVFVLIRVVWMENVSTECSHLFGTTYRKEISTYNSYLYFDIVCRTNHQII